MKALCLLVLVVTTEAKARLDRCSVSEWGEWSDWTVGFNNHAVESWEVPVGVHSSEGTKTRLRNMKLKAEARENTRRCRADGSCPELAEIPSEGFSACVDGLAGNAYFPCENVDQMGFVSMQDMAITQPGEMAFGNDIWGWTSPTGREYAIMGSSTATGFVDVTEPSNPRPVGVLNRPTGTPPSFWRDIKVIGDTAYVVSEAFGSGIQSFDLNRLESVTEFTYFTEDHHYSALSNCHNIIAHPETNMLYAVGCTDNAPNLCDGGLYILDATDPLEPKFVACFGEDRYVHDAECVVYHGPDSDYTAREICFCYNEDTFTIVDVDDKSDMKILSRTGYAGAAYTHQGSITSDHSVVLMDDEADESNGDPYTKTYIWDVQDLDNPVLKTIYHSSQESYDHNQYIVGDFTYQANYASGLRIHKVSGYDLVPVAHFDVLPPDAAEFYGSWSVYPYFSSGTVVVSSIDYGLFVLRPDMVAMEQAAATRSEVTERRRFRQIMEASDLTACPTLSQTQRA